MINSSKLNPKGVQICLAVLVSLTFALALNPALADIELSENLSVSGFIDMSSVISDDGHDTSAELSFDQVELDFHIKSGNVSARIDLNSGSDIFAEQAWVMYKFDDMSGLSVKAGMMETGLGFEGREPVDLFQFSHARGRPHADTQNGVEIGLQPDPKVKVSAALLSGARDVDDTNLEEPGIEAQVRVTPDEKITAAVGIQLDDMTPRTDDFFTPGGFDSFPAPAQTPGDETDDDGGYLQTLINGWASFADGPLTVAGEVNFLRNWGAKDRKATQFLGMANVSLEDAIDLPAAVTVRFSGIKFEGVDLDKEITVSPSILPGEGWTILAEFRRNMDAETTQVAFESIFAF